MGCMSPLYATPPISPGSDNGPNFEDHFETPSAIFSAHNMENNDHFARDTHMRIILGNNKDTSQHSKLVQHSEKCVVLRLIEIVCI